MAVTGSRSKQIKRKLLWLAGGLLVLVLTAFYLYQSLHKPGTLANWERLKAVAGSRMGLFSLCWIFLLMLVNWGLEVLKWHVLLKQVERLSPRALIKSVLAGLSLALFTPARLGEYGGRVLYLKPGKRLDGTLAMLVGSLSQMLVTILCSLAALNYFLPRYLPETKGASIILPFVSCLAAALLLAGFFALRSLEKFIAFLPWVKRFSARFEVTSRYRPFALVGVFSLSLLRYLIFSSQYYLLMGTFGFHAPIQDFASAMAIVFVIQSLIPAFALADLGVRGAASGFFLGLVYGQAAGPAILAATFGIWLINIILPALCGLPFVVKLKSGLDNAV